MRGRASVSRCMAAASAILARRHCYVAAALRAPIIRAFPAVHDMPSDARGTAHERRASPAGHRRTHHRSHPAERRGAERRSAGQPPAPAKAPVAAAAGGKDSSRARSVTAQSAAPGRRRPPVRRQAVIKVDLQEHVPKRGRLAQRVLSDDIEWIEPDIVQEIRTTCWGQHGRVLPHPPAAALRVREVNRAKAGARNCGADIIDLGMGNPDLPAPAHVIEKLKETIGKSRTDRYSASKGIPGLRRAQAAYYARRFGVKLNPETQIITTLGSKEGFANVAQAITAPGDVVIVPNPTYPIHVFGFLMAGGAIRSVPVEANAAFFGALERAVLHSDSRSRSRSWFATRRTRRPVSPTSISTATLSPSRRSTRCWCCRISPMPRSISTTIRRPRSCRCRARWTSPSNSPRCRRPIRCPAGGSVLRSATSASSRRWRG